MNCAEIDILICEYVDGSLAPAERGEVERHLGECPACAALARDSAAAVAFMERAAEVEPPPELVTRILFAAPWRKSRSGWFSRAFNSVLSPRFAMSMALTVLSFGFLWRPGQQQWTASDLQPTKVWAGLEDRGYRIWARTVKFYDNLKFVYQIQTTLREWQQDQEAQPPSDSEAPSSKPDEHRLPVRSNPAGSSSKTTGGTQ